MHLAERQLRIADLALDLSDGLKLINLLEQISAKRLPKYTKVVKFHNQKLENVGIALKFLKDEGLKLVAIGPEGMFTLLLFFLMKMCLYTCCRCGGMSYKAYSGSHLDNYSEMANPKDFLPRGISGRRW